MTGISARLRALAPALIALVIACVAPAGAHAATYDITSCNSDGSAAGWSSYGGSNFQSGILCPYNGDLTNRGLGVANAVNSGVIGSASGGLMFKAPAGTSLAGIGTGFRVQRWDASYWAGLVTGSGQMLAGFWANDGNGATAGAYSTHTWFNLNRESNLHLEVGCGGMCDTAWMAPTGFRGWVQLFDPITVRIEDDNAPVESLTGGGLIGSAYATGTQAVTYTSSDASGIRATRLYVDGSRLRDDARSCNFEQPVPCSNVSGGSYSVDTTALADGSHSVKVETVDAAGNPGSQSRTVSVDNHAPTAPALTLDGGEGWRNSNDFAVSWTNPGGQIAPIATAHYQLCQADQPTNCEPAGVQSGSGVSSLSRLSVPREGDYTLTVWLEDAAGNTSVSNASAPVHLRYDSSAPGRVSDLKVAGGEGWRSTNSFDLTWTTPDAQLAPVAAAHYRLCDEDGTCTNGVRSEPATIESLDGLRVPGPGSYTLTLWLEDAAGNVDAAAASSPVRLRFDDTDPGQAEPRASDGWLGATAVAGGYDETISDAVAPPSGIAGFAVSVDGSQPGTSPNVGPDGVLHIAELSEGSVTVKARAISNSGVASSSVGSAVLLVDKSAPEMKAAGAPDPDDWQADAVTLQLRGSDELSGMEGGQLEYSLDGADRVVVPGGSASIEVSGDGRHSVRYAAVDAAGNRTDEKEVTFQIDGEKPGTAQPASSDDWVTGSEPYVEHIALADGETLPLSGVAGFSVTTDGSAPDETADVGPDGVLTLNDLPDGVTTVKARAVSGAGVASDSVGSGTIKVDRTAPEVALQRDASTVTASVSDASSGLARASVEYRAGGGDWISLPGALHDGTLTARLDGLAPGTYALRAKATDVAGNERSVTRLTDGSSATVTVSPPAQRPVETGAPTSPAAVAAPAPAPAAHPVRHKSAVRCTVKSKRSKQSHGRKHHKHAKRHAKPCVRSHRKGGEKHRSHHLGGKTHKHPRRSAGQRKDPK